MKRKAIVKGKIRANEVLPEILLKLPGFALIIIAKVLCLFCKEGWGWEGKCSGFDKKGEAEVYRQPINEANCHCKSRCK